jgi:hypothetical protein
MTELPWQEETCTLGDANGAGALEPSDRVEATFEAIEASSLNAFAHLDQDAALEAARSAVSLDVSLAAERAFPLPMVATPS